MVADRFVRKTKNHFANVNAVDALASQLFESIFHKLACLATTNEKATHKSHRIVCRICSDNRFSFVFSPYSEL